MCVESHEPYFEQSSVLSMERIDYIQGLLFELARILADIFNADVPPSQQPRSFQRCPWLEGVVYTYSEFELRDINFIILQIYACICTSRVGLPNIIAIQNHLHNLLGCAYSNQSLASNETPKTPPNTDFQNRQLDQIFLPIYSRLYNYIYILIFQIDINFRYSPQTYLNVIKDPD
jgi:hypothetical protein